MVYMFWSSEATLCTFIIYHLIDCVLDETLYEPGHDPPWTGRIDDIERNIYVIYVKCRVIYVGVMVSLKHGRCI